MKTSGPGATHRSPEQILPAMVVDAAHGRFPPADGSWIRVPPWRRGVEAVVSSTGFAVLAVSASLRALLAAGFSPIGSVQLFRRQ